MPGIILIGLMVLAFLTGLTGMIVCDAKNIDTRISFFAVLGLVLPIVMWVVYLVAIASGKDKAKEKLDSELMESNLSADEVMEIGEKINIIKRHAREILCALFFIRNGAINFRLKRKSNAAQTNATPPLLGEEGRA